MAFLLLTLLVQAAFAMVARNAAQAAVAASARRASRPQADLPAEQAALHALLGDSIPGATGVAVKVTSDSTMARSSASFTWHPPGPGWMPLTIRVRATAPNAVPP
ncbi:MAG: hypothetical protein M3N51_09350 [Actinomycetota bacterium]|nr:hypothetical protein [Actinomycetota bacterium]